MGNIYAIGDIHGCYDKLVSLMKQIEIGMNPEEDTVVFLGDYIDRGAGSYQVVEYLIRLKTRIPRVVFLKGNHEIMLEMYLSGADRYIYLVNGGSRTLEDYMSRTRSEGNSPIPPHHLRFFSSLAPYHQTEDYIFVHAGMREEIPLDMQKSEDLFWIRGRFIYSEYDFGKRVVFGHTPFTEPLMMKNKIGIDTGAVYGNKLTCVKLPEVIFFHS